MRKRKFLSVLLSLAMILSCVNIPVYADEYDSENTAEQIEVVDETPEKTAEAADEIVPFADSSQYTYITDAEFVGYLTRSSTNSLGANVYTFELVEDGSEVYAYSPDSYEVGCYYIVTTNSSGKIVEIEELDAINDNYSVGYLKNYYYRSTEGSYCVEIFTGDGLNTFKLRNDISNYDISEDYRGAVQFAVPTTEEGGLGLIRNIRVLNPKETYHNIEYTSSGFAELKFPCNANTTYLAYYGSSLTPGQRYTVDVLGYGVDVSTKYIAIWPVGEINSNISYEILGIEGDVCFNGTGALTEEDTDAISELKDIINSGDNYVESGTLTISEGITSLNGVALGFFKSCSIPSSVSEINNVAFKAGSNISVSEDNPYYCSVDGTLFDINMTELIHFGNDSAEEYREQTGSNSYTTGYKYDVPETVTVIGNYAFSGANISAVTMPEALTIIGDNAFSNSYIRRLALPDSLEIIGNNAFYYCRYLSNIVIPGNFTEIGENAFYHCDGLTSLTISDGVISIGKDAFSYCSELTEVTVPDSVTNMGNGVFSGCSKLESAMLGSGITHIADSTFSSCYSLSDVTFPDSITSIGSYAFSYCGSLTNLEIPSGVTEINDYTFYCCEGLTNIEIPSGVTRIGDYAFYSCTGLTSIEIPSGVTEIGNNAFSSCSGLTSVILGNGSVSASWNAFDSYADFEEIIIKSGILSSSTPGIQNTKKIILEAGVTDIEYIPPGVEIEIREDNPHFNKEQDAVYNADKTKLISVAKSVENFSIPDGVTQIGDRAFSGCSKLKNVEIPDSVESIGNYAFSGCTSLTDIEIPDSVTEFGNGIFSDCGGLKNVKFSNSVTYITDNMFSGCDGLTNIEIPENITEIGEQAFSNCAGLTSITIPDSVTKIGYYVFSGCSSLKDITLGSGVSNIIYYVFDDCTALENIYVSDKNTNYASVDGILFNKNKSTLLKYPPAKKDASYSVPDRVTKIDKYAFYGCENLENVTINDNVRYIEDSAFRSCTGLKSIVIPERVVSIGRYAFSGCTNLTEAEIRANAQEICYDAFSYCTNLEKVTVLGDVEEWGWDVFYGCYDVVLFCYEYSSAYEYAVENGIPYELLIDESYSIVLTVNNESGEKINSGLTAYWYEKETGKPAGEGLRLKNVDKTKEYTYLIVLEDSDLVYSYKQPEKCDVKFDSEDNVFNIEYTLTPQTYTTISGTVTDSAGNPIVDAQAKIEVSFAGYTEEISEYTDASGKFSIETADISSELYIYAPGYYSRKISLTGEKFNGDACDLGNIVMTVLPNNKISLLLYVTSAVKEGEEAGIYELYSADNISFTLNNKTQGKKITNFSVQYPYIVLNDVSANANDEIEIITTDNKREMTSEPTIIELDENKMGTAAITFVQHGRVEINSITGNTSTTVMTFNEKGGFVRSETASRSYMGGRLPEGTYTLLFIKNTPLLRNVGNLSSIAEFGLTEGEDYVTKKVSVTNGTITEIDEINVPQLDESKLYYTIAKETSCVTSNTSVVAGKYMTVRVSYSIDSKYESADESVKIELPDGIKIVESSLILDNKKTPYTDNDNVLTVNTGKNSGVIRFYVLSEETGDYSLNAYLNFVNNGNKITQPIGSAAFEVTSAKITIPEKTSKTSVGVSGTANPGSDITVYDNNIEVGKTTSNKAGSWNLTFDLVNPYNASYHNVYAVINNSVTGISIKTETSLLVYNKNSGTMLSKVTMINTGDNGENVSVFDFINPGNAPSYRFWPGKFPKFTFNVEFTDGDDKTVSNVRVITTDSSGGKVAVPCIYDSVTKRWIGTANYYTAATAPYAVDVAYDLINSGLTFEYSDEESEAYGKFHNDIVKSLSQSTNDNLYYSVYDESDDSCVILISDNTSGMTLSYVVVYYTDFDEIDITNSSFKATENGDWKYKVEAAGDEARITFINEKTETAIIYGVPTGAFSSGEYLVNLAATDNPPTPQEPPETPQSPGHLPELPPINDVFETYNDINDTAEKICDAVYYFQMLRQIEELESIYNDTASAISIMITAKCKDGSYRLSSEDMQIFSTALNGLRDSAALGYSAMREDLDLFRHKILKDCFWTIMTLGVSRLSDVFRNNRVAANARNARYNYSLDDFGLTDADVENISNAVQDSINYANEYSDYMQDMRSEYGGTSYSEITEDAQLLRHSMFERDNEQTNALLTLKEAIESKYKKCDEDDEPEIPDDKNPQPATPIIDPSGYVYEAVPSNRVEGVKAEAYYYDYALDEFGMPEETKSEILWDAEEYNQTNPLFTDANGMYAWDVPVGQWLVRFSKNGYYDTDSSKDPAADSDGYLPVPPPQTEVNTAIVSKNPPTVRSVNVYNDEVQIIFSQYMQPETVNSDTVTITCGGNAVSGTIAPSNAENDYEGENEYASIFVFTPESPLSDTATVTVENAKNYAGTAMSNKYEQSKNVTIKPESISATENVDITYNSGALVEVQILPKEAGVNKKLTVSSSSPSIVGVVTKHVTTDSNGKANIMLNGNLSGEGEITISLNDTDISTSIRARVGDVENNANKCEKVQASVATGSTVAKGTKITISTPTEGARIYYTLDLTCPCEEDNPARTEYTAPIEITEATTIIAYAVKEGFEDSNTAGFVYNVSDYGAEITIDNNPDIQNNTLTVSYTLSALRNVSGKMYAAVYGANGEMLALKVADKAINASEKLTDTVEFNTHGLTSPPAYIKLLMWDEEMKPLANYVELKF